MKAIALVFGAVFLRFLFVSPFMVLFWWIRRSAKKAHPRENGTTTEFSLAPSMLVLIEIVILLLLAFTVLVTVETIRNGEGFYASLIPLSVLIAILLAKPRSVWTDHEGIHQHCWLRGDRIIAWNEIASMKKGRNTGTTYIKSRNGGRPVSFSALLVGRSRFEKEVRRHIRDLALDE